MTLNEFVSAARLAIFEDLKSGRDPRMGTYDPEVLRQARTKGVVPQLGSTQLAPQAIQLEFIYPDARGASIVLVVTVPPQERIVFLPVPNWVVESIWQGEISGSHHFESHARSMVEQFSLLLTPDANLPYFGRQEPTRRD